MNFADSKDAIETGKSLSRAEASAFLGAILDDTNIRDEAIAEVLTALTKKQPTIEEVCGFVEAMQQRMTHIPTVEGAIDTCGTGGDKSGTFNISTASAILVAASGVPVAKHGNRAATSKCGSADVLEAFGIPVDLDPTAAASFLVKHDFVFLFAPLYHPALKRLAGIRKSLGFPTVFNLLGPLLNPAGVKRQVIGTFSLDNAKLLAEVMAKMDHYEHALVLTSGDGLDEASLAAPVIAFEIVGSKIMKSTFLASDFGLNKAAATDLAGDDAQTNARIITNAFEPTPTLSAHQSVICLNTGIALYVAGKANSIKEGIGQAQVVLKSGAALAKLKELQGIA
jgi:anthranilate phosphoribosyltransferase